MASDTIAAGSKSVHAYRYLAEIGRLREIRGTPFKNHNERTACGETSASHQAQEPEDMKVPRGLALAILPLILTSLGAPCAFAAHDRAGADPAGPSLLHRSIVAMHDSVRSLHTDGQIQAHLQSRSGLAYLTGDCVMGPASRSDRFWERGTAFVDGAFHSINAHYVTIVTRTSSRTWERGTETHNRWRIANSDQGALLGEDLCPPAIMDRLSSRIAGTRYVGTFRLRGRSTQHVRVSGSALALDFYIDPESHYWLRAVSSQTGKPALLGSFDYSQFNHPVSITQPRVGATSP